MIRFIFLLATTTTQLLAYSPPRATKYPPWKEIIFKPVALTEIKSNPSNHTDNLPVAVTLDCEAEGDLPLTYRWTKNGLDFDFRHLPGIRQINATGTLAMTYPEEGQYQCFASNRFGTALFNPVFLKKGELQDSEKTESTEVTATEGEPFKLTCKPPLGSPQPLVHWYRKNANGVLHQIDNPEITADPEGTLWFQPVTLSSASSYNGSVGWYACLAFSRVFGNKKTAEFYLNVTPRKSSATPVTSASPNRLYVSKEKNIVLTGESVEFYCIYGGSPLPTVIWLKGDQPIIPEGSMELKSFNKILRIVNITFDDEGEYTCTVSNGVGQATYQMFQLEVLSAPYFTLEPKPVFAQEGEAVKLSCGAAGKPTPKIQWLHNGRLFNSSSPDFASIQLIGDDTIIISNFSKHHIANYGCNASNANGYIYKDIVVTLKRQLEILLDNDTIEIEISNGNSTSNFKPENSSALMQAGGADGEDNDTIEIEISNGNSTNNFKHENSSALMQAGGADGEESPYGSDNEDAIAETLTSQMLIVSLVSCLLITIAIGTFLSWYCWNRRQGNFSHNPNRISAIVAN